MKKLITLCMIVKNEDAVLERCLSSVTNWIDEIVIVDTGSTDRTKEIAYRYTDKVIDFEWCDDFSAARNVALQHATGIWILQMDADEYMEPLSRETVHDALRTAATDQPIGFELSIYNLMDRNADTKMIISSNVRLFLNHPEAVYARPIHELVYYNGEELPRTSLLFKIYHTGYQTDTYQSKRKNERNLAIFHKYRQDGSMEPIDYFYLGNEYYALGQLDKARYYLKRAFEHRKKKHLPWVPHAALKYTDLLTDMHRLHDAVQVINECICIWPNFPDFYCYKARILGTIGLDDEALALNHYCIELAESMARDKANFWLISPEFGSSIPYEQMASIYAKQLRTTEQVACLTKLIKMNPYNAKHWHNLLLVLLTRESDEAVLNFLNNYSEAGDTRFYRQILHVSFILKNATIGSYVEQQIIRLNESLTTFEMLYLALLKQEADTFGLEWEIVKTTLQAENEEVIEPVWIAALIFNNSTIIDAGLETITNAVGDIAALWFKPEPSENNPLWNARVIDTLKALFLMGEIDHYNRLYKLYQAYDTTISNAMGDFLFDIGQYEPAFTYYLKQLETNELQLEGYLRLIQYYFHFMKDRETARQMAEEAVKRFPNFLQGYFYLIRYLTEGVERTQWQNRLRHEVSLPIPLSEIQSLLKA